MTYTTGLLICTVSVSAIAYGVSDRSKDILAAVASGTPFYEILANEVPQPNGEYRQLSGLTQKGLLKWLEAAWDSIDQTRLM
jgi:hypothetical protein